MLAYGVGRAGRKYHMGVIIANKWAPAKGSKTTREPINEKSKQESNNNLTRKLRRQTIKIKEREQSKWRSFTYIEDCYIIKGRCGAAKTVELDPFRKLSITR